MLVWKDGEVREVSDRLPQPDEVAWLHLRQPDDETVQKVLGEMFHVHPLAIEDVLNFGQRAKVDRYPIGETPHILVSFHAVVSDLTVAEFCVVLGDRFVVTVERKAVSVFEYVDHVVRIDPTGLRSPAALLHKLLDRAVDQYLDVADNVESRLDRMQERVFQHPELVIAPEIFRMQRRLHRVRRIAADARTVIGQLMKEDASFWDTREQVYYADVLDHASHAADHFDAVRDILSGLLDLQTSQRAMRMNEVMRTLTVIATIFLPLTFIVGVYGMNFHDMPELSWRYGYVYVWSLMIAVTLAMLYYFKRKGWW